MPQIGGLVLLFIVLIFIAVSATASRGRATINRGFMEGETIEHTVDGRSPAPVGRWVNGLIVQLFVVLHSFQ